MMVAFCLFGLGVVCFVIGIVQLLAPVPAEAREGLPDRIAPAVPRRPPVRPPSPAPVSPRPPVGETPPGGRDMVGEAQKFNWVQVGQRITVRHPVRGEWMAHVMGRILYAELWQRQRGPQNPWVPTGNAYLGFWLEGDLFLLNWQNRVYLLDEAVELSDAEIQRVFAPHARKFAQSDQTADVYFAYPPASWHIDDIGKFRVEETTGEGLRFRPGAVGRFIHASGEGGRALVVEDYEGGGGGRDTAWIGYQITEEEVKPS